MAGHESETGEREQKARVGDVLGERSGGGGLAVG